MTGSKICLGCKQGLPLTSFYKRWDKRTDPPKQKYIARCKSCHQKQNKTYWTEEKKREYNEAKKQDRRERKERAVIYKGGKCEHCLGSFHIAAYDFHHINPDEKDVDPGLLMQISDEILFKELDKCILLCANCHRIHHYEEGTLGKIRERKKRP